MVSENKNRKPVNNKTIVEKSNPEVKYALCFGFSCPFGKIKMASAIQQVTIPNKKET